MSLSKHQCQDLINQQHDWEPSTITSVEGVTYVVPHKRTFKKARVSVLGKQYPQILKEIITKYEVGDFCAKHRDNSWRQEFPGYVAYAVWITPLNNDYEGGDLYFSDNIVEQRVGKTIKMSTQNQHEITKVTKGTRYSLVSWVFKQL